MHSELICMTFCLYVCMHVTGPKFILDDNLYPRKNSGLLAAYTSFTEAGRWANLNVKFHFFLLELISMHHFQCKCLSNLVISEQWPLIWTGHRGRTEHTELITNIFSLPFRFNWFVLLRQIPNFYLQPVTFLNGISNTRKYWWLTLILMGYVLFASRSRF